MTVWSGRFDKETDRLLTAFSESISFDKRLYAHDIKGSIAHVMMLAKSGIIPDNDADLIIRQLGEIKKEIDDGSFTFHEKYEDIHMNIEQSLIERLGETGAKIHSARSRNDQIATDIRLYLRDEIDNITHLISKLQSSLVQLAEENITAIMPGFTHLQHAQPVLFAHHLLAYVEMLSRDYSRLIDCRRRLNQLPLGSGAIAGTTLPINREFVANELEFDGVTRNSMDTVSDRDFIIELLGCFAIVMMHMSRFSEDIIYWASRECSFIELDDAFCTGSSLMPQKKNPDIAELTRGKTGRVYGNLVSLLTVMKGLPLCYNRDMQEDKEPLFDTLDTVKMVLTIFAPMVKSIVVKHEIMKQAASDPYLMATDLAEWLVMKNVPFRTAHKKVGELIAYCQANNLSLGNLSVIQMQGIIPEATEECLLLFDPENSVIARNCTGGTSPEQVQKQLDYWRKKLS